MPGQSPLQTPLPPKDVLPDGLAVLSSLSAPTTTQKLSATFQQLGYDLNRVANGDGGVPRVLLSSFPGDHAYALVLTLRTLPPFQTVLPLLLVGNE